MDRRIKNNSASHALIGIYGCLIAAVLLLVVPLTDYFVLSEQSSVTGVIAQKVYVPSSSNTGFDSNGKIVTTHSSTKRILLTTMGHEVKANTWSYAKLNEGDKIKYTSTQGYIFHWGYSDPVKIDQ